MSLYKTCTRNDMQEKGHGCVTSYRAGSGSWDSDGFRSAPTMPSDTHHGKLAVHFLEPEMCYAATGTRCHKMSQVDLWIWDDLGHGHDAMGQNGRISGLTATETLRLPMWLASNVRVPISSHLHICHRIGFKRKMCQETLSLTGMWLVNQWFPVVFLCFSLEHPWTNPLNMLYL